MSDPRPIGVFDSGVGGLTVLRELQRQLPNESTIYFADLGHFPYGPRYQAQVRTFALNIIRFLEKLDVKLVVIACNTATAAALNPAREIFDIPIIGVITPGAEAAVAATRNKRVGVISTEGTMQSQEYLHAIREANPTIGVLPKANTARHQIYATGSPKRFTETARILFGQELPPITTVRLELVETISGREGAA